MTKRTDSALKTVTPNFLANVDDDSLDFMKDKFTIPTLKIIQSTVDKNIKKKFGEGSAIVRPGDQIIWKYDDEESDEPFQFVPLFIFIEYCKWSAFGDTSKPMIMVRTTDKHSDIAKKALNPDTREELYEGHKDKPEKEQQHYSYVEHYRVLGVIYGDHMFNGIPLTLSFERGENWNGVNFVAACQMRRQLVTDKDGEESHVKVPLWAQVWNISVSARSRGAYNWYGLDFAPGDPSEIQEKDAQEMQDQYKKYKKHHEEGTLEVADDMPEAEPKVDDPSDNDTF